MFAGLGELFMLIGPGRLFSAAILVAVSIGRASGATLAIDVQSGMEERPAHLCIVHFGPGEGVPISQADNGKPCPKKMHVLRVGGTNVCVGEERDQPDTWSALRALAGAGQAATDTGDRPVCGADAPGCSARVSLLPAEGTAPVGVILCAKNHQVGGRVLVLHTKFHGLNPALKSVDWSGDTAIVSFASAAGTSTQLLPLATVSVVGGHYTGRAGHSEGGRAVASVSAICTLRDIVLPRVALEDLEDRTTAKPSFQISMMGARCERNFAPAFSVLLPRTDAGTTKSIEVRVHAPPKSAASESLNWLLTSEWRDAEPPNEPRANANEFQFQWSAGCEFMAGSSRERLASESFAPACPSATLPEAGVRCVHEKTPNVAGKLHCAYRCEVPGPGLPLPTSVRLQSADGQDSWTENLSALGQTLAGYAQRERRYFPVEFSSLADLEKRRSTDWDKVEHLRLRTSNGETFVFIPQAARSYRISLPGGTCGDQLEYEYVGDRDFDALPIEVTDGKLRIEGPERSQKRLYFLIGAGGGAIVPFKDDAPTDPFVSLGFYARAYLPAGTPLVQLLGFSYSLNLGRHRFKPAYGDSEESVLYQRHLWMLSVSHILSERFRLDLGAGLGIGEPFFFSDSPTVGDRRLLIPLNVHVGFRAHRRIELDLGVGTLLRDAVHEYLPRAENSGTPSVQTRRSHAGLFTFTTLVRL
jgi:hypothetical protein